MTCIDTHLAGNGCYKTANNNKRNLALRTGGLRTDHQVGMVWDVEFRGILLSCSTEALCCHIYFFERCSDTKLLTRDPKPSTSKVSVPTRSTSPQSLWPVTPGYCPRSRRPHWVCLATARPRARLCGGSGSIHASMWGLLENGGVPIMRYKRGTPILGNNRVGCGKGSSSSTLDSLEASRAGNTTVGPAKIGTKCIQHHSAPAETQ